MISFKNFIIEKNISIEYKYISGTDLSKFITYSKKNRGVFDRIKYLHPSEMTQEDHIIALEGEKIVGNLAFQINPYNKTEVWLKHVSVDEKYRNKGIAKKLAEMAVEKISKIRTINTLAVSSYTKQGFQYLPKIFTELDKKYKNLKITK